MKFLLCTFSALLSISICYAQSGAGNVYSFLDVPSGARLASLGGRLNANEEFDPEFVLVNPSLLAVEHETEIALAYVNYFSDINFGNLIIPFANGKKGSWAGSLVFADYGEFEHRDASGSLLGTFQASDYSLGISYARSLQERLKAGVSIKGIASYLEAYESYGIALDGSLMYIDTAKHISAAILVRNLGSQLTTYTETAGNESLPFDVQLAVSKRLEHLPLRWGIVYHHLQQFDISYQDEDDQVFNPAQQIIGQDENAMGDGFGSKLLEHLGANVELNLGKALDVRIGYDHLRRNQMSFPLRTGRAGFSFGFGLEFSKLSISYANSMLNLAGSSNHFSLQYKLIRKQP